jgi:hypothetical protein
MESQEYVWVFPRDFLYISWGSLENQIDCSWRSIENLDGFLSNIAMLTLKSMQKEFDVQHSVHLIKYLEAFMSNEGHKGQSNMVQTIFAM